MKVSVAMTTYNGEKYILQQLQSLLDQTRTIDEVIIFDDCSKDNTADIVNGFIEKNSLTNWHFKVNEVNCGFVKNFFNSIKSTTGDIIFLCDQDDIWDSHKIEEISSVMEKNPKVKVVNSALNFIDQDNRPITINSSENWIKNPDIYEKGSITQIDYLDVYKDNLSPGCTMAFTKEIKDIFVKVGVTKELPHDWEVNMIGSYLDSLYYYNSKLINYRIHSNNTIGVGSNDIKAKPHLDLNGNINYFRKMYSRNVLILSIKDYISEDRHSEDNNKILKYNEFLKRQLNFLNNINLKNYLEMNKYLKYNLKGGKGKIFLKNLYFLILRH